MEPGRGGDLTHWSNDDFESVRPTHLFKQQEDAWHEQRGYFSHALAALAQGSKLKAAIEAEIAALDSLSKAQPAGSGMKTVPQAGWGKQLRLRPADGAGHGISLRLSPSTGAIESLIACASAACDDNGQTDWGSEAMARFVYRSRNHEAGVDFYAHYQYVNAGWGPRVCESSCSGPLCHAKQLDP